MINSQTNRNTQSSKGSRCNNSRIPNKTIDLSVKIPTLYYAWRSYSPQLDAMTDYDPIAMREELDRLRLENVELKRLASHLMEDVEYPINRDVTWIFALEGSRDGVWDWNPVTNEIYFSKRWKEMLGFEDEEIENAFSEWDCRMHPDDRNSVYTDLESHMNGETLFYQNEHRLRCKDASYKWILDRGRIVNWTEDGEPLRIVGTHTDITLRKETEIENQRLMQEITAAFDKVKLLTGLLPICSNCKKIRDDKGCWNQIESYVRAHSEAEFTHGICPECVQELYPDSKNPTKKEIVAHGVLHLTKRS